MSEVLIPKAFKELFEPHRYKAYHGGRGSAKSHSVAQALVLMAAQRPMRIVCAREIQNSLRESVKQLIEDKIKAAGLEHLFDCQDKTTNGLNGSRFIYMGMWRNPDAVKSLEAADVFWGEEASRFSERSLRLVRPTMRKPGSELWFTWNPEFEHDPIDRFFRGEGGPPPGSVVRQVNWEDNPFFAGTPLQDEMEFDYRVDAAKAEHVWGGGYVTAVDGAYFAAQLAEARRDGRLSSVSRDPLMQIRAFWDIGGTGAKADACAIWIAQFVGREIRVLDYYEAQGQPLATHIDWLRSNGYAKALCVLPHDGATNDRVYDVSYASALRQASFEVRVVTNQGKGAAKQRIEAARRLFPMMWFDEAKTRPGVKALSAYHEKRDENRNIGLGPEHDWASHGSDAFGLMCVAYEQPYRDVRDEDEDDRNDYGRSSATGY